MQTNDKEVKELEGYMHWYTDHLNTISRLSQQLEIITGIIRDKIPEKEKDFTEMKAQLSFNTLLTVSMLDLLVIARHLMNTKGFWEEVYFLRQGYLTIYETVKTYHRENGKLRILINEKYPSCEPVYTCVNIKLKSFKKEFEYDTTISTIRNKIAGHIDQQFLDDHSQLGSLDRDKASQAITAFVHVLADMLLLSNEIVFAANQHSIAQQIIQDQTIHNYKQQIQEKFEELKRHASFRNDE